MDALHVLEMGLLRVRLTKHKRTNDTLRRTNDIQIEERQQGKAYRAFA